MATATRGDLYQYAMGSGQGDGAGAKPTVVAGVERAELIGGREGPGGDHLLPLRPLPPVRADAARPSRQASGAPQSVPSGGSSAAPFSQGGGSFGGGQGGFPGGERGGVAGTVTAVQINADGTAAVTISVEKLPSSAKLGSTGFARIQVKVLAKNAVLIPTAAVKGSGSSATVQVSANGSTETRTITRRSAVRRHDRGRVRAERGRERAVHTVVPGVPRGGTQRNAVPARRSERHAVPAAGRPVPVGRDVLMTGRGSGRCCAAQNEGERA